MSNGLSQRVVIVSRPNRTLLDKAETISSCNPARNSAAVLTFLASVQVPVDLASKPPSLAVPPPHGHCHSHYTSNTCLTPSCRSSHHELPVEALA
jgi:hypothetical protein